MNTDPNDGINVWEITYAGDNGYEDADVRRICADIAEEAIEKSKYQNWCQDSAYILKVELIGLNGEG